MHIAYNNYFIPRVVQDKRHIKDIVMRLQHLMQTLIDTTRTIMFLLLLLLILF